MIGNYAVRRKNKLNWGGGGEPISWSLLYFSNSNTIRGNVVRKKGGNITVIAIVPEGQ